MGFGKSLYEGFSSVLAKNYRNRLNYLNYLPKSESVERSSYSQSEFANSDR